MTAEEINTSFASGFGNAFSSFAEGAKSAKDAFKDFAANFLSQMASMIIQATILKAIGGVGGPIGNLFSSVPVKHSGGVVGNYSRNMSVNPAVFTNAPRYHGGGIAGLKPNEVPSVLKRGEEVLTEGDPRHVRNGGGVGGGQSPVNVKVINAIDSASVVREGLDSGEGEKSIMNIIKANRAQIRTVLA